MVIRFGIFELDTQSGELRRHGQKIRLPDQAFHILRLLLDRPGEVVTREELRQALWTSDTSVDFDVGLNSAIRKLREALDDSAENSRFVETLPRRGYRFIASIQPATTDSVPEVTAGAAVEPRARIRRGWMAGGFIVVAIAALVGVYGTGWWQRMSTGTAAGHIRSLAVLPFDNLTGDSTQDFFVIGVTDALTTDLAEAGGFDVIARASAMRYKGTKKPLPVIGRELNVDALLAGAIVRSEHHVRITAQLSHAATERLVWAQSYEGELSDVVALQQKIARSIATAIRGRLASPPSAHSGGPPPVNPEAYDAYLKGLQAAGGQTYEGFRTAVSYFEVAVARQPDFAAAYSAMAQAQLQFLYGGPLSPREAIPNAEASARKALQLDESIAQAHRTLGTILREFYYRWDDGGREFRRARELNAMGPDGAGELIRAGRFEESIAAAERARTLDPLSLNAYLRVATAYRAAGQFDRAIAEFGRAIEMAPGQARAHFQLGVTYIMMGRVNDASKELETAVASSRRNPRFEAYLGYAYAVGGRPRDARNILTSLQSRAREQYVSSFGIALIHDALGEKAPALAALERAFQDRAVEFAQMDQYPPFKTIGSEPQFLALMRKIGRPRP